MITRVSVKFAAIVPLILGLSISWPAFAGEHQSERTVAPSPPVEVLTPLTNEQHGDIFMARKQYDDAIDYYERALRQGGVNKAVIWNKTGIAYQEKSDYGSARKCYKKALRLDSKLAAAWNNLGTTYYLKKNAKKAIKYYRKAVRLKPEDASLHMNLGTAYYARKKYRQTVGEYEAALRIDPNVLSEHSESGSVVEAREADANYYFYVAKAFASLGRAGEAVRYLEHAMEDGYKNYRKIKNDPDFQKIKDYPAYVELLKNPPVAIKD